MATLKEQAQALAPDMIINGASQEPSTWIDNDGNIAPPGGEAMERPGSFLVAGIVNRIPSHKRRAPDLERSEHQFVGRGNTLEAAIADLKAHAE